LYMGTFALAACEGPTGNEKAERGLRPALTKLIGGDEFPSFHTAGFEYGSEGPAQPIGGMTAQTWHAWAREAWPKACHHIEARLVKGRLRDNRQCTSEHIAGIVPVEKMRSAGFLEIDGNAVPAVWTWSRFPENNPASCKHDPAPSGTSKYLLTRSSDSRNWQLYVPMDNHNGASHVLDQDGVWQTCGDIRQLLEN
jgi:hypothetical protein